MLPWELDLPSLVQVIVIELQTDFHHNVLQILFEHRGWSKTTTPLQVELEGLFCERSLCNCFYLTGYNQSNVFIKPFLHQPMSQSAIQKPNIKPQTASNADLEARLLGKTPWKGRNLGRNLERHLEPGSEGCPVLFWLCWVEVITEHGQVVQTFIDDQQGQIIIITGVVEGATGQHLRSKCQLAFHSWGWESRCSRERER